MLLLSPNGVDNSTDFWWVERGVVGYSCSCFVLVGRSLLCCFVPKGRLARRARLDTFGESTVSSARLIVKTKPRHGQVHQRVSGERPTTIKTMMHPMLPIESYPGEATTSMMTNKG
jgi:hypothetical protein